MQFQNILFNMLRRKILEKSGATFEVNASKRLKTDTANTPDSTITNQTSASQAPSNFPNPQNNVDSQNTSIPEQVLQAQVKLNHVLAKLNFKVPPIEYIYNPLEYAFNPNENYIRKYCTSTKKFLFVGMNPGPFGMCQTGVPFGDPNWVKEWLKIGGVINRPEIQCPERLISGFDSSRKEPSGDRLWGFFSKLSGEPEVFFKHSFVCNFCPLAFMNTKGSNVTPNEIKNIQVRKALEDACNEWFLKLISILQPQTVIAIGTYVEKKTLDLFKANLIDNINVLYMPHPSPRAVNNTNWHEKADNFLTKHNIKSFFQKQ